MFWSADIYSKVCVLIDYIKKSLRDSMSIFGELQPCKLLIRNTMLCTYAAPPLSHGNYPILPLFWHMLFQDVPSIPAVDKSIALAIFDTYHNPYFESFEKLYI